LPRNGLDLKQSPLWSETPTASESSANDGPESLASMTCDGLWPTPTADSASDRSTPYKQGGMPLALAAKAPLQSSSSPVGSLANLIPLQESVRRLLTIVTSGPRLPVSFARFDRDGSSGRMFPVSSTPNLDGSSAAFSGTWPTWGIALDGACGELPTLERCTAANESSSWPTPTANEDAAGQPGAKMQPMLGNHPSIRGSGSGTLNPRWVEWLMGFPDGHTALEPSEMPSSGSKRSRSSPKSPESSE
jgi:hypothetical protein